MNLYLLLEGLTLICGINVVLGVFFYIVSSGILVSSEQSSRSHEGLKRWRDRFMSSHPVQTQTRIRKGAKWLLTSGVLAGILAIVGLVADLVGLDVLPQPIWQQEKMYGDVRIAVSSFALNDSGKIENQAPVEFAHGVYLSLSNALEDNSKFTIWNPEQTPVIAGETPQERARNAARIADRIGADILIYGVLEAHDSQFSLQPEFYIHSGNIPHADEIVESYSTNEIVGLHQFGDSITLLNTNSSLTRIDISERISERAVLLARLTEGIAQYTRKDYDSALALFLQVEDEPAWDSMNGKQLLYLLIGNTLGKKGDYVSSGQYFRLALEIDKEYSRAYLGIANILFLHSLKHAIDVKDYSQVNTDLLNQSIEMYKGVPKKESQPESAHISAKVHFGLGQGYLVHAFVDPSLPLDSAFQEFQQVVDMYQQNPDILMNELTSEAHARLGLIHQRNGQLSTASKEYELAASLVLYDADRQQYFSNRAKQLADLSQRK